MSGLYKRMIMPLTFAAGLSGLAGIVSAEERKITRDETQKMYLKLNQDQHINDSLVALITGDEKSAEVRLIIGLENSRGGEDQTPLDTFKIGPNDAVVIYKGDLNGDKCKDITVLFGPKPSPTVDPSAHKIVYLSDCNGKLIRQ